ncbi:MAG: Uncharacterized protein G01um101416_41 [Microgenomates group bacterium Gr01-1014_16]|nr:MAG: Uncharacterized protein G01um101416_41 [Microgenomates group bacterium Gr01-1014_16]
MIIILQLLHAVILWVLEFAPYPELFIYPYLTFSGFLPYRDILDQHFPGLMFFPLNFYSLGFRDPIAFKLLLILVVTLTSVWIYKISRSRLSVFFYVLWQPFFEGNQLWLDVFLPIFTLPAFYFFQLQKWFLTGLFLGLGVVFKQTLVPLVAFVGLILLFRRKFSALAKFSFAALLPSFLMLVYLQKIGVLSDFWYWTIKFNLSDFAASGSLAPRLQDWIKLSLPIAFIALAFIKSSNSRKYMFWLLFTIIGGIARFGLIHLQPAVPFFALALSALSRTSKPRFIFCLALTTAWLGYFYTHQNNLFQTKYFDSYSTELAAQISRRVQPGDRIFLLGVNPHLYPLTWTLPPARTFVFQFPWFINTAGDRILNGLRSDPPQLVVYNPVSNIDNQYLRDYGSRLVEYIQSNYMLSSQIGPYLIYENRP